MLENFLTYVLKKDSNNLKKPSDSNNAKLKTLAVFGDKKSFKKPPRAKDMPRNKEQTKFITKLE